MTNANESGGAEKSAAPSRSTNYRPPKPAEGSPPVGFPHAPGVRTVTVADIASALRLGIGDFFRAPQYGLFFGGIFVLGGFVLLASVTVWDTSWAIVPLAIAFPLLGPFIAVGLYEVSRRLSEGERLSWGGVLGVVFKQGERELIYSGFVMLFIFWIWAYQARILLAIFLGSASFSTFAGFFEVVTTTENGWTFLAVGSALGAILSLVLFSVTVVSVPLLLDRDIDFVSAMVTSVVVVRRSPGPMIAWGLVVTALMILALAPYFLGLLIILPILGHATWRLYERAIIRSPAPA